MPRYSKQLINNLIVAEEDSLSEQKDERDYIQPSDFMVGKEVNLLGHRFLVRDCDARTRKYYEDILKVQQGERVMIDKIRPIQLKTVRSILIWNWSQSLIWFTIVTIVKFMLFFKLQLN